MFSLEVTVDMRVKRARAPMLQLYDLDAGDLFTNEPSVPAPRIELCLPGEQDAFTQPILECFELGGEFEMQQRGDAVRLRVVECPVEQEVGVRAQPLMAALFPGDWVVSGEPDTKAAAGGEFVGSDEAVRTMNRETVEPDAPLYPSSASTPGESLR